MTTTRSCCSSCGANVRSLCRACAEHAKLLQERDEARAQVAVLVDTLKRSRCADCGRATLAGSAATECGGPYHAGLSALPDSARALLEERDRVREQLAAAEKGWTDAETRAAIAEVVVEAARESHEDCDQAAGHRANPARVGACRVCDAIAAYDKAKGGKP